MARYQRNRSGIGRMLRGKPSYKATRSSAREGARILETVYPVDTGQSKAAISVESGMALDGERVAAFIVVDDPSAAPLEIGNAHVKNPPRPFSQTLTIMRGR